MTLQKNLINFHYASGESNDFFMKGGVAMKALVRNVVKWGFLLIMAVITFYVLYPN